MRGTGRIAWLPCAVLALVLAGCGGGAAPAEPSGSIGPSASPIASLDPAEIGVCEAMLTMEAGLARVQSVKLRAGARKRLDQALQSVLTGQDALLQVAPFQMATQLRSLGIAIDNLEIAVEDFRTTLHLDEAAADVKRSTNQLRKAIDVFQHFVGCDAIVLPTAPPNGSPEPSLAPYDSPGASIQG